MRFQCGQCAKYYRIENSHVIEEDLNIKCSNCENDFTISPNLSFSSSSENSKIVCENCGKLINEKSRTCYSCNLILNKNHEELRIDNKDYELLEVVQGVKIISSNSTKKRKKRGLFAPVAVVSLVLLLVLLGYFATTNQASLKKSVLLPIENIISGENRIETHIVILKSGKTFYADKVEHDGSYVKITSKNGVLTEVSENDILQISKAIIED